MTAFDDMPDMADLQDAMSKPENHPYYLRVLADVAYLCEEDEHMYAEQGIRSGARSLLNEMEEHETGLEPYRDDLLALDAAVAATANGHEYDQDAVDEALERVAEDLFEQAGYRLL